MSLSGWQGWNRTIGNWFIRPAPSPLGYLPMLELDVGFEPTTYRLQGDDRLAYAELSLATELNMPIHMVTAEGVEPSNSTVKGW